LKPIKTKKFKSLSNDKKYVSRWKKIKGNYAGAILSIIIVVTIIPSLVEPLYANHGKEIFLKFNNGQFFVPPGKNVQQVKLTTTYTVADPDIVNEQISGVMKVFSENGTLIKTTSIPNGFKADKIGFQQFVTTIPISSVQSIKAVVIFTELNQSSPLSNSVSKSLILNKTA
jgi:hypothetical protein